MSEDRTKTESDGAETPVSMVLQNFRKRVVMGGKSSAIGKVMATHEMMLILRAMQKGLPYQVFSLGTRISDGAYDEVFDYILQRTEGTLIHRSLDGIGRNRLTCRVIALESQLECDHDPVDGDFMLAIGSLDETLMSDIAEFLHEFEVTPAQEPMLVSVIVSEHGQLQAKRLGSVGLELERGNYCAGHLEAFDSIVSSFGADNPRGRLTLIHGPPGSGKTYFVRGIVAAAEVTDFILVPPDIVSQLSTPGVLPFLIDLRARRTGGVESSRTALIIEDADSALVPRGVDNMSAIQNLLALGDGILGSALDIRIIATTNARNYEVDEALKRKGRLLSEVHIGRMDPEHANAVLRRLVEPIEGAQVDLFEENVPLGDVYDRAAAAGWRAPESSLPLVHMGPRYAVKRALPSGVSVSDVDGFIPFRRMGQRATKLLRRG